MFRNARSANDGYHRDSTLAAATSPFGGDLNRSTQHLLILPDEEVCAWMHGPGSRRNRRLSQLFANAAIAASRVGSYIDPRSLAAVHRDEDHKKHVLIEPPAQTADPSCDRLDQMA